MLTGSRDTKFKFINYDLITNRDYNRIFFLRKN